MKPYNHKANEQNESCGFTDDRYRELTTATLKKIFFYSRGSEAVEQLEKFCKRDDEFLRFICINAACYLMKVILSYQEAGNPIIIKEDKK